MKKLLYPAFIVLLCLSACKKGEEVIKPIETTTQKVVAPKCLFLTTETINNSSVLRLVYQYDEQKKVISATEPNGKYKETYTYSKDKMKIDIVSQMDGIQGETYECELNTKGYITKSTDHYNIETHYIYDKDGYLIRKWRSTKSGKYLVGGESYLYTNGNNSATYELLVDIEKGIVTDSVLDFACVYDENMPGNIDVAKKWISREGKGNKNALKAKIEGKFTTNYEYEVGDKGLPSFYQEEKGFWKEYFTWKCD
jgi:hypothetical protein